MPVAKYRRLWLVQDSSFLKERRKKSVRLAKEEKKVQVRIITAERDNREKVDNKPNKNFGKMVYETFESFDVYEATPDEVLKVIETAIASKSK